VSSAAVARYSGTSPPNGAHRILALLEDKAAAVRAAIPLERAQAALLLISGKADERNPATLGGDAIVARLKNANYPYAFEHLAYDDAGHNIGRPYRVTGDMLQGTPSGNERTNSPGTRRFGFLIVT
jgi:hypothetical protein